MSKIKDISFDSGGMVIQYNGGPPKKIDWTTILAAADIPTGLTHTQVDGIRLLANVQVIILRTLLNAELIGDQLGSEGSEWDLEAVIYALEQMGGSFEEPDIDNVEDA
jgi:hypothetical protein